MALMMSAEAGLSAFPDGDNIFQWTGTITGGSGTVCRPRPLPGQLLPPGSHVAAHTCCLAARCQPAHAVPAKGRMNDLRLLPTRPPHGRSHRRARAPLCQVYEGLTFKLSLKFPTSYPYESPQVTFLTPCFHPNVDQYGNICLDILKARATPTRAGQLAHAARSSSARVCALAPPAWLATRCLPRRCRAEPGRSPEPESAAL